MKKCELCNSMARMYCESDQASLCWDCDAKVHSANFLVTKHSRILLCHACQSLTPWTSSGPKLARTVSVCHSCATSRRPNLVHDSSNDDDDSENQIVPTPDLASSSSSCEESSTKYISGKEKASSSSNTRDRGFSDNGNGNRKNQKNCGRKMSSQTWRS